MYTLVFGGLEKGLCDVCMIELLLGLASRA